MDHGISISKLGGIFHFNIDTRQFLKNIFSHQTRMPAGSTGHDYDSIGIDQGLLINFQSAQRNRSGFRIHSATQGIVDCFGLFKDLFQHEMIKAPFLDGRQLNVQLLHIGR